MSCLIAFVIPVTIVDVIAPNQGPIYTPGSTVQLMCSSTCTGSCFVLQQTSSDTIMKDALHALDSGNHTCTVVDDFGNTGNSTFKMVVSYGKNRTRSTIIISQCFFDLPNLDVHMYLFDNNSPGIIPNNSIILTNNFGQIPELQCISGSRLAHVGQWFAPSGQDITLSTNDPFDVVIGGQNDPGYLDVSLHFGRILTVHEQGVYNCLLPDETGMNIPIFVGIYIPALISMLTMFDCERFYSKLVLTAPVTIFNPWKKHLHQYSL